MALALGASLLACARGNVFQERGLPADLPRYLGQLKTLKVPAEVGSLAWIPSTLRELDASKTRIESIAFVPMGMERLTLESAGRLRQLPTLPTSIRELDIRGTQISAPWRFPHELEYLALGGPHVETLEGLSGVQLRELNLENVPNLQSTSGLPASLQVLSISQTLFPQLSEIPPNLKELRLENTQIRTLQGLPASLQSMTLIDNGVIEADLPRSLLSLTLGPGQRLSPFDQLVYLNHLQLRQWVALEEFPLFLRDLRVPVARQRISLPPGLRRLEIEQAGDQIFSEFPPGLEELRWPGGADLSKLPLSLKHLSIPSSVLSDLSGLPPKVELKSLDVSQTDIGIDKLPNGLCRLRYWYYKGSIVSGVPLTLESLDLKDSVDVRDLRGLPPRLRRLIVSGTSIKNLPLLPISLTELDISNTRISDLQALKGARRLRSLTIHSGQLRSLAGLPASVSELRFVEKE